MSDLKNSLGLIDEKAFADFRGVQVRTLRNERSRGKGPEYQRIGRKVFYPLDSIRQFSKANATIPEQTATLLKGMRTSRR